MTPHPSSHSERYVALRELLLPWSDLWRHSILKRFDEMERVVPEDWFRYGASADFRDQFALAQGERIPQAPESLQAWIRSIRSLYAFPIATASSGIRAPFDQDLTPKKKHEIEAILGFLREEGARATRILDVGGGAGHLARHLAHGMSCPVESIDRDRALQEKGLRLTGRYPWRESLKHPIRFIPGSFPNEARWNDEGSGAWAIGLHTCGDLAWSVLELAQKGFSILSFGCCYEKLTGAPHLERSRFARERPLALTDESLFLANRGGVERPLEEFLLQQQVHRYRFALHELLLKEGADPAMFGSVGNASENAYSGSFADYVRDRLRHFGNLADSEGLPRTLLQLSETSLEDFHRSVAPRIESQRFVAFLRVLLSRPIEVAILLDRALHLEESRESAQMRVRLLQLFDPRVSPRNLALVVSASTSTV